VHAVDDEQDTAVSWLEAGPRGLGARCTDHLPGLRRSMSGWPAPAALLYDPTATHADGVAQEIAFSEVPHTTVLLVGHTPICVTGSFRQREPCQEAAIGAVVSRPEDPPAPKSNAPAR
jgi:hypothetical protein